jgi:hypothetical protein
MTPIASPQRRTPRLRRRVPHFPERCILGFLGDLCLRTQLGACGSRTSLQLLHPVLRLTPGERAPGCMPHQVLVLQAPLLPALQPVGCGLEHGHKCLGACIRVSESVPLSMPLLPWPLNALNRPSPSPHALHCSSDSSRAETGVNTTTFQGWPLAGVGAHQWVALDPMSRRRFASTPHSLQRVPWRVLLQHAIGLTHICYVTVGVCPRKVIPLCAHASGKSTHMQHSLL